MTEQDILDTVKTWSEEQKKSLMRGINNQRDKITQVWDYTLGKQNLTFYERDKTTILLSTYGFDNLKRAFASAKENGIDANKCLPYVSKVLENLKKEEDTKKQREITDRQIAEAREKAKDISLIAGENIRAKPDIGQSKWVGFADRTLSPESKLIKDIFDGEEI